MTSSGVFGLSCLINVHRFHRLYIFFVVLLISLTYGLSPLLIGIIGIVDRFEGEAYIVVVGICDRLKEFVDHYAIECIRCFRLV